MTVFFTQLGGCDIPNPTWIIKTKSYFRATALPIANSVFIHGLVKTITEEKIAVLPKAAVEAGPTNLAALTTDSRVLHVLRMSYVIAVRNSLLTLALGACMEWRRMEVASKLCFGGGKASSLKA